MAATDLYDLAREYLDACAAGLALSPAGAISRAYVAPGPPAWDCCPQLTVHVSGPVEADTEPTGPQLQVGFRTVDPGLVNLVSMTATVLRCIPTSSEGFPPADQIEAAAYETLGDVWTLWNYLRRQVRAGALFTRDDGEPREVYFDPTVVLVNAGGCGGWQIQVRVMLEGYAT